ncbi:MAG: hydantoinase/carbamoylase family amidase [Gemmataceae bacterium]|nr:hydantoinase/carbamoylase family amidase [Gemmataceae bacterium]
MIANLRELALLTSTEAGAQRLAWSPMWRTARAWFAGKVQELGLAIEADSAGNHWVTLKGPSDASLVVGSHLDSVPNGGWLDGCLGVLAGLEVLRRQIQAGSPPVTLRLVDWADEEGRFGRSLLGSSAAAGTLVPDQVRNLTDQSGVRLSQALCENGVDVDRMPDAQQEFQKRNAKAYLELHIEQGPVLESLGKPAGVVLGTVGLTRHALRFVGQAAHAGSTPLPMRRDAFLAAAELALACRESAERHARPGAGVVCTVGHVQLEPNIPTAVPGVAEITLDQRALDGEVLASLEREARAASERIARAPGFRRVASVIPAGAAPVRSLLDPTLRRGGTGDHGRRSPAALGAIARCLGHGSAGADRHDVRLVCARTLALQGGRYA